MTRKYIRVQESPSSITIKLFEIILEAEDQNIEFDIPDQKPHSIRFNQIVKDFHMRSNLEFSCRFRCLHTFWPRSGIMNRF